MLRLQVTQGMATGTQIEVDDELVIGRAAEGAAALAGDAEISREHARIARGPGGTYSIEDLGSRNGTHVNGRRITAAETLLPGDSVEVGGTKLVVQVTTPPPAETQGAAADTQGAGETAAGTEVPVPIQDAPADAASAEETPAAAQLPRLALRLDVDFEAGEATLELDGESQPVKLVHQDGRWRIEPGG